MTLRAFTVVAAVVEQDGRFLLTRRQAGVHLEGCWEFPGGKVHDGESHEAALRREMLEELDTAVQVGERVLETAHDYPERRVHLHFYRCSLAGTPRPVLGQEMNWVDRRVLATLPFPDADRELIALLSDASGGPVILDGIDMPRVIGRVDAGSGPTLVVVGGLHGNEPAGALGLSRIFARLGSAGGGRLRGTFVGLAGNVKALARSRRYLRDDLNRIWLAERLAAVRSEAGPLQDEDEELRDLDRQLTSAIDSARGPVTVFDVHCMSGEGPAFVTLDDTLSNRAVAFRIPSPCVLGLEEELRGTLTEYLVGRGFVSFGFEAGQLRDPRSVDRAEAAIWIVLHALGIVDEKEWPEVARSRELLRLDSASIPPVLEVRHRQAITPGEGFEMRPGFVSFQAVREGQPLARNIHGPITAPHDGLMLMPLYQGQGSDGFFLVRPVRPVWLAVSSYARRLPLHRFLGWLPGVSRDPADADSFLVDTRKARWLALQIFHLLGFKRRGQLPHGIVMRARGR